MKGIRTDLGEALARTLAVAGPLGHEDVDLDSVVGRVLAADVSFPTDLPAASVAAMDGYAVCGAAAAGARFDVRGESRAGAPLTGVALQSSAVAVAISTGAELPATHDTVLPWEDVERSGDVIVVQRGSVSGQHVRRAGSDARRGSIAVAAGTRLAARHVAALAAAECRRVRVATRPRVLLLVTGDELRAPGTPTTPGSVVDSNTPLLAALARQAGALVSHVHVPDRDAALERAIVEARADLIVTVGGAADGEHDHVTRALAAVSAETIFRGVAIKPGKPVTLARHGAVPLLALPGNPGSAFVTFVLLGVPLLRAQQGDRAPVPPVVDAATDAELRAPRDRLSICYGALVSRGGALHFHPEPAASSGSVAAITGARALALVAAGTTVAPGDSVPVLDVDAA